MAISVEGKAALVTGGGSGINLAFVKLLLSKGCSVIIGDLRLRPEAEELLTAYPYPAVAGKPAVVFQKTNVVSWPEITLLWRTALEKFTTIDVVVPGAGLFEPKWSAFWEPPRTESNPESASLDPADGDPGHYASIDVNLVAPIRISQLAISHWTKNKQHGSLLHVGSMAGYVASPLTPLYFASKHGLHGFVKSLGALRDTVGIRVSLVAPSAVMTPLFLDDPSKASMLDGNVFMAPEEVADAMWQLTTGEEYGDGTILEVLKGKKRVIPMFNAEPPSGEFMIPGYAAASNALIDRLNSEGLDA